MFRALTCSSSGGPRRNCIYAASKQVNARNMQRSLQKYNNCIQSHLVGQLLTLIHDTRTHDTQKNALCMCKVSTCIMIKCSVAKCHVQQQPKQIFLSVTSAYKNTGLILEGNINPLKPELSPICYLMALLAHHFLHVSRIRVKSLTFRRLMSYIYIYIYIYIWSTHS